MGREEERNAFLLSFPAFPSYLDFFLWFTFSCSDFFTNNRVRLYNTYRAAWTRQNVCACVRDIKRQTLAKFPRWSICLLPKADGTAWMALYCLVMLNISLELTLDDSTYGDMAFKFFEHFTYIADAMNKMSDGNALWDPEDGFYYDHFKRGSESFPLRVRSVLELLPLLVCWLLDSRHLDRLPGFRNRLNRFLENRKEHGVSQVTVNRKVITVREKEWCFKSQKS